MTVTPMPHPDLRVTDSTSERRTSLDYTPALVLLN